MAFSQPPFLPSSPQIYVHWYLYVWVAREDYRERFLYRWLHFPTRPVELAGFQCDHDGVSCVCKIISAIRGVRGGGDETLGSGRVCKEKITQGKLKWIPNLSWFFSKRSWSPARSQVGNAAPRRCCCKKYDFLKTALINNRLYNSAWHFRLLTRHGGRLSCLSTGLGAKCI